MQRCLCVRVTKKHYQGLPGSTTARHQGFAALRNIQIICIPHTRFPPPLSLSLFALSVHFREDCSVNLFKGGDSLCATSCPSTTAMQLSTKVAPRCTRCWGTCFLWTLFIQCVDINSFYSHSAALLLRCRLPWPVDWYCWCFNFLSAEPDHSLSSFVVVSVMGRRK